MEERKETDTLIMRADLMKYSCVVYFAHGKTFNFSSCDPLMTCQEGVLGSKLQDGCAAVKSEIELGFFCNQKPREHGLFG